MNPCVSISIREGLQAQKAGRVLPCHQGDLLVADSLPGKALDEFLHSIGGCGVQILTQVGAEDAVLGSQGLYGLGIGLHRDLPPAPHPFLMGLGTHQIRHIDMLDEGSHLRASLHFLQGHFHGGVHGMGHDDSPHSLLFGRLDEPQDLLGRDMTCGENDIGFGHQLEDLSQVGEDSPEPSMIRIPPASAFLVKKDL